MRTYQWWRKQKRRVQKKYTLFLGRYLSPKEKREWYNKWISSMQELKDYAEWLPQYEGKW